MANEIQQQKPYSNAVSLGIGAAIGAGYNIGLQVAFAAAALGGVAAFAVGSGLTVAVTDSPDLALAFGAVAGISAIGGVAYGTYKLSKKLYNKVRDNLRLDKLCTASGAVAGFVGLSVLQATVGPDINIEITDELKQKTQIQAADTPASKNFIAAGHGTKAGDSALTFTQPAI